PVLIALLADLPLDQVWEVEDYLSLVAGAKAPAAVVSADESSRKKAVDAWKKWWADNEKTVVLTNLDPNRRELGCWVGVENFNPANSRGRVLEVDATGKVRWEVGGLLWPIDGQVLRGGNVLIIAQNQVSERDRSGKPIWERYFANAFHCERLRNGHTFIACRNMLTVVDKGGKQLFTHYYHQNSILAARRFRDGSM